MVTRPLEMSQTDTALILNGLLELSARLDRAQDTASRNGDVNGVEAIGASRSNIGDLYDRVRNLHIGNGGMPTLAGA